MKKYGYNNYRIEDRDYWDGEEKNFAKIKEEREDKRKKKRFESALKTKNVKKMMDYLDYNEDDDC